MAKGKQKGFVNFKQIFQLAKQNYFVTVIALCVLFVGVVAVYKLFFAKPTYVYVKVKVGQGLWWANTSRPSLWFIKAIQRASEEKDLTGQTIAKIINAVYYPWYGSGQYDAYVTMRLRVSSAGKEGKYSFKRQTIGVGVPVDFEFPEVQFSGTIIQMSELPIQEKYTEKIVYLTKKNAFPWEYDAIKVGDSYFDGMTKTLEVLDKQSKDTSTLMDDLYGGYPSSTLESRRYIFLKIKIRGKITEDGFMYNEDQILTPGRVISMMTQNLVYNEYTIARIE